MKYSLIQQNHSMVILSYLYQYCMILICCQFLRFIVIQNNLISVSKLGTTVFMLKVHLFAHLTDSYFYINSTEKDFHPCNSNNEN